MIALPGKNTALMIIGAIVGIVLSSLIWIAYNALIGHPKVAEEARAGYVVLAEKTALETKLKIEEKRRADAERISTKHVEALEKATAWNEAEKARLEKENADYEARLEAAGRRCDLDGSDIEWLRKP